MSAIHRPPRGIFISHRRRTAPKDASLIFSNLRHHLPVFTDADGLQSWALSAEGPTPDLSRCGALLVLIDPDGWAPAGRRALHDPEDPVRREIRTALQAGLRVVPLLLDGAVMPPHVDLPAEVRALADAQALSVMTTDPVQLAHGIDRLLALLQSFVPAHHPAWASAAGHDAWGHWADLTVGGVSQRLRRVSAGEFRMGSPASEAGRRQDEPQRLVRIDAPFWLADTACSQAFWHAVTGQMPAWFKGPDLPVEQVSWDMVVTRFLSEVNRRVPGLKATLPSEAQWEYACRAGTATAYHWGDAPIPPGRAQHEACEPHQTVSVKSFEPNAWGLYQMHGNVMEWCAEGGRGDERAVRGGSWSGPARVLRSACRVERSRTSARNDLGFRFAVPAD